VLSQLQGRIFALLSTGIWYGGRRSAARGRITVVGAIGAFTQGKPVDAEGLQKVIPFPAVPPRKKGAS
jgi:hypothetical protein